MPQNNDEPDRIYAKNTNGLASRVDQLADVYGMSRSQMVRLLVEHGVGIVEENGLDAVVQNEGGGAGEAAAEGV